ncbi:MAG: HEPN domain-containing protein, partial [Verrucomicrobia bacterium]|nr:HEPN domain-containing protein [Verrucomicrobiota bacterium]
MPPDSPGEWLNRARSDLAIARTSIPGAYLEDLCYHAQQAVEKALKALLLQRVGRFPYVHDLAALVSRLEEANVLVPDHVRDAVALTKYAVEG